jgi:cell division protein FtsL
LAGEEVVLERLGLLGAVEKALLLGQVGAALLLQVNLEHVQHTSLDVSRPRLLLSVEDDVSDL